MTKKSRKVFRKSDNPAKQPIKHKGQADIVDAIKKLQPRMGGQNYGTTFGFEVLGHADSQDEVKVLIQRTFPEANALDTELVKIDGEEFWEEIRSGFEYRGDDHAGMELSGKEEETLQSLQGEFRVKLKNLMNSESLFFYYPSEEGIPVYDVYWGFRLVFNNQKEWYFLYGSASD